MSERLDLFLVRMGYARSRREARELINNGSVSIGLGRARKGDTITPGEEVRVSATVPEIRIQPNHDLRLEVLYQDTALLVVNKPGLMPCHPLHSSERDTVLDGIVAAYPEVATAGDKALEGGLVHRLDNGTSGALVIARTPQAFAKMRSAIRQGEIARRYLALCLGEVVAETEIATPIAHHPKNPRRMVTAKPGESIHSRLKTRPASTRLAPLRKWREYTLVEVSPRTGSRHQIRVHFASIGHPLLGDELYGGPAFEGLESGRFWLHLAELSFESPSGEIVSVEAPLPNDLNLVLEQLDAAE